MTLVNMRFEGRGLLSDVVTWTPERDLPFFRITEAPLAMPWLAPEGKTMLTVDIGCEVGDSIWTMPDEQLAQLCLDGLERLIPGVRQRYLGSGVLRTPVAHPVFLREYEADRLTLERGLPIIGLHSIGRNGEFAHILMEDVYWRTLRKVHQLATRSYRSGPQRAHLSRPAKPSTFRSGRAPAVGRSRTSALPSGTELALGR